MLANCALDNCDILDIFIIKTILLVEDISRNEFILQDDSVTGCFAKSSLKKNAETILLVMFDASTYPLRNTENIIS